MEITLVELSEKLRSQNEYQLIEWLGITSEDIVDRFQDIIEDGYEFLLSEIEDIGYYADE